MTDFTTKIALKEMADEDIYFAKRDRQLIEALHKQRLFGRSGRKEGFQRRAEMSRFRTNDQTPWEGTFCLQKTCVRAFDASCIRYAEPWAKVEKPKRLFPLCDLGLLRRSLYGLTGVLDVFSRTFNSFTASQADRQSQEDQDQGYQAHVMTSRAMIRKKPLGKRTEARPERSPTPAWPSR